MTLSVRASGLGRRILLRVGLCVVALAIALGIAHWTGILRGAAGQRSALTVDERTPLYREFRERSRRVLEALPEHESEPMPAGHLDRG